MNPRGSPPVNEKCSPLVALHGLLGLPSVSQFMQNGEPVFLMFHRLYDLELSLFVKTFREGPHMVRGRSTVDLS